jgi:predicted membrane GTPase involved in stress response
MRDFAITHEVLRAYGDAIKDLLKKVLKGIEIAREDGLMIGVSGLDEFDIGDFGTELADAERLLSLGIESPTLKQQIFKKLALKYLCDVRQVVKDRIASEIDAKF